MLPKKSRMDKSVLAACTWPQLQWFSERGVCSHSLPLCRAEMLMGWHVQEGCIREKAKWRELLVQAGMFAESQQSEEVQRVEKKCWCDEDLKTDGHFRRLARKMRAISCASVHVSDGMSFTNWQGYASKGGGSDASELSLEEVEVWLSKKKVMMRNGYLAQHYRTTVIERIPRNRMTKEDESLENRALQDLEDNCRTWKQTTGNTCKKRSGVCADGLHPESLLVLRSQIFDEMFVDWANKWSNACTGQFTPSRSFSC